MGNEYQNTEIQQSYYIMKGEIINNYDNPLHMSNSTSVYEVIRVMEGTPLFLEEHLDRLNESLRLLNHAFRVDVSTVKFQIHQLISINQNPQQNIKIVINDLDTLSPNTYLFFINSKYPCSLQYEKGVSAILYSAVRDNPNIKAIAHNQREIINEAIKQSNVYEAILVNEESYITEGSRSNIFVIKSNRLYTAPAKNVLMGITRGRVINLCEKLNIPVIEADISIELLKRCDGLFLTGTSPKILPIDIVDQYRFSSSSHPVILRLRHAYDELIKEYMKNYNR